MATPLLHNHLSFLEHRSHCGRVIEGMSLRGAERRSKLRDKDKIASPLAGNDTVGRKGKGIKGVPRKIKDFSGCLKGVG